MQLNFSFKKAWNDLFSDKKYIWQLLAVTVVIVFLELLGDIYPIKGPKFLATIIIAGYTSLIAYNIINSKERVLNNIFNNPETNKFILLVGLKLAIIESIYLFCFYIPGFPLALFLMFRCHLSPEFTTLLVMLILSPILFYMTIFPSITFSKNLKFIDAFNLKNAFKTLKFAWKDYLLCFLVMTAIFLGIFSLGFVVFNLIILGKNNSLNFNSIVFYISHMKWSFLSLKLPQNSLFYSFGGVISSYFGTHIVAQVYKYTLNDENLAKNKSEYNITTEEKERSMEVNFGIKKTWNDLIESKGRLNSFIGIGVLLIILSIVDTILKTKVFSSVGNLLLNGYFILMMNNIINNRTPILEDLGTAENDGRNLFLVILKGIGIGIIYGLGLLAIGVMLFLFLSKIFILNTIQSVITAGILLIPFIVLISLCNLLFAENLKFGDAFNIMKAVASFKIAWKKYIAVFCINFVVAILAFLLMFLVILAFGVTITLVLKNYPAVVLTREASRMAGGIFGSLLGEFIAIIISYWYLNAVAQIYRYSLAEMNITES